MNTKTLRFPLVSNGFPLDLRDDRLGWLTPSEPRDSAARLWEQFQSQGYLWLKNLLDRQVVEDAVADDA